MVETPGKDRKSIWYGLLSAALAVVLLYYSLRGVEWARVWTTITHARWQFLLAACLTYLTVPIFCAPSAGAFCSIRDAHFDVVTVFEATMAGYLGNSFLPARAGEFVRSYIISSRSSLTKTYVFTTALSERMMDAIVLVLASSVVLLGVNPKPSWLGDMSRTTAVIAGAGLLTIAIVPHTGDLVERLLRRIPMPAGTAHSPDRTGCTDSSRPAHISQPHAARRFWSLYRTDLVRRLRHRHAGRSRPRHRTFHFAWRCYYWRAWGWEARCPRRPAMWVSISSSRSAS